MKSSEPDLAILRTDSVLPRFRKAHGDYPRMFERLLMPAVRRRCGSGSGPVPCVDGREAPGLIVPSYDARTGSFPDPRQHRGYLITGSRSSVYDDEPWIPALAAFLEKVLEAGGKVVGICFGHQLIAHFFGGEAGPAPVGWCVGVQHSRIVHREPWMEPPAEKGTAGEQLRLIASHKDQVIRPPGEARVFATSEVCPVGGFVMGEQVMTLQGHPEFEAGYARDLLFMRRALLGEDVFRQGIESLSERTDAELVAEWILNFLDDGEDARQ